DHPEVHRKLKGVGNVIARKRAGPHVEDENPRELATLACLDAQNRNGVGVVRFDVEKVVVNHRHPFGVQQEIMQGRKRMVGDEALDLRKKPLDETAAQTAASI